MQFSVRLTVASLLLTLLGCCSFNSVQAQNLQYEPYGAWRGRAVARDGLLRTQRYRWGGGITQTGGQVLTTAINAAAPILGDVFGTRGGEGETNQSRGGGTRSSNLSPMSEYNSELQRAQSLLATTQALAGLSAGASAQPITSTQGFGPKLTRDEVERKFGISDPWK